MEQRLEFGSNQRVCKECHATFEKSLEECPRCKAPVKRMSRLRVVCLCAVGILVALIILSMIMPEDSPTDRIERELRIKVESYGASSSNPDIPGACQSLAQTDWRYSGDRELQYRNSMSSASRIDHTVDSIAAEMDYNPSKIRDYCNSGGSNGAAAAASGGGTNRTIVAVSPREAIMADPVADTKRAVEAVVATAADLQVQTTRVPGASNAATTVTPTPIPSPVAPTTAPIPVPPPRVVRPERPMLGYDPFSSARAPEGGCLADDRVFTELNESIEDEMTRADSAVMVPLRVSVGEAKIIESGDYRGVERYSDRPIIRAEFDWRGQSYEAIGHIYLKTCETQLILITVWPPPNDLKGPTLEDVRESAPVKE